MLETFLKFGSYRIDYFDRSGQNPNAFAFYVCGGMEEDTPYSRDAKHQLYRGLAYIHSSRGLKDLAAVYIDVNDPAELQRPAYLQLKHDLLEGLFKRIFVMNNSAILHCPQALQDFQAMTSQIDGLELLLIDYQY